MECLSFEPPKNNFGQRIWVKSVVLFGTSWGEKILGMSQFDWPIKKIFKTLGSPKNRIQLDGLKIGNGGWCVHGSQWPYIHRYRVWPRVSISTHGCGGGDPSTKMVDLRDHTLSIGPLEFF
jgi:hypothetical protein